MGNATARRFQADAGHCLFELESILGLVDGRRRGADQRDVILGQHAFTIQIECAVQRGLTAHGRQDRIGAFFGDDAFDHLPGDWLDIGAVGHFRIGHDGGRITVDQNDAIAFLAQCLAGLRAGVIELASLTDDDRAGAEDENGFQIATLGHVASLVDRLRFQHALHCIEHAATACFGKVGERTRHVGLEIG